MLNRETPYRVSANSTALLYCLHIGFTLYHIGFPLNWKIANFKACFPIKPKLLNRETDGSRLSKENDKIRDVMVNCHC